MLQAPAHPDHAVLAADAPPGADLRREATSLFERLAEQVPERRSIWTVGATGIGCGVLAWLTAVAWDALVGAPVSFTVPMIALAIWFGGVRGGTIALLVTLALLITFEFEPVGQPWTTDAQDLARLIGIIAASGALMVLYAVMGAAVKRGRQALARQQELTAAMTHSENRWRTLSATAPALIMQSSAADGSITFANEAFEEYAGGIPVGRDERYGKLVHPDDLVNLPRVQQDLLAEHTATYEARLRRADGAYRWHAGSTSAMRGSDGEFESFVSVYVDVHDRKVAEQALATAEQRWRSLADATPAMIFEVSADGEFLYDNEAFREYTGESFAGTRREERLPRMMHPDDVPVVYDVVARLRNGERDMEFEWRPKNAHGEYRWHVGSASVMPGDVDRWLVTSLDIDERKRAEQALFRSESEFRALIESSPAFVFRGDARGRMTYASPGFFEYLGVPAVSSDGARDFERVLHPDDVQPFIETYTRSWTTGSPADIEYRLLRNDGQYRWFLAQTVPVRDAAGAVTGWVGTAVDIHDRKMAEEELEYRERELQLVVDTAKVYTFRSDAKGRTVHVSSSFTDYTGLSIAELTDRDWAKTGVIHEDDLPRVQEATRDAVAAGEAYQLEYRVRGEDGAYRWHLTRVTPEHDASGAVCAWQGVSIEVDQLHRTREDLEQALDAKDEFLGMVSHELRTPITTIAGNAHVLARKYGAVDDETRTRALTDINDEANRLSRIVDNLLALARLERGETPEIEPVLLRRLIEQVCASEEKAGVREYEIHVPDIIVLGNSLYIEQILRNLISNARKYSPAIEPVTVTAGVAGGFAEVVVADRGIGLDGEDAARIFEPFWRSERTAGTQGAGIGLAVCRRLVETLGGTIEARPRPDGRGTEFRFTLPVEQD